MSMHVTASAAPRARPIPASSAPATVREVSTPAADAPPAREVAARYFAALNARDMHALESLYAPDARFDDNVFHHTDRAGILGMWRGLPEDARVRADVLTEKDGVVTARIQWRYTLGGMPVVNDELSQLTIKDGRITSQLEKFDFGAWASQLVPLPRGLLGFAEPVLAPLLRMFASRD